MTIVSYCIICQLSQFNSYWYLIGYA